MSLPAVAVPDPLLTGTERDLLSSLNRALHQAWAGPGRAADREAALREYLASMAAIGRRLPMFTIANNRIYRADDALIVPYALGGVLAVFEVDPERDQIVLRRRLAPGTIVTDASLARMLGSELRAIDLEGEIYRLDLAGMPDLRISHLRDMVRLFERLNRCGSRYEAVYHLRFLVSRLCVSSSQGVPGAKNIQPEVVRLRRELTELLNGPFADHLRLSLRILVRYVSGIVSRPKLIDELWQSTIDLCEVEVRGSAITNEIRRSAHHALGQRTLDLARAYDQWLRTGQGGFPGHERPVGVDEAARNNPRVRTLVARIVEVLEKILGSSEIVGRLDEWRTGYAEALLTGASGNTLEQDLEALIEHGIRAANRWSYQRHLRNLARQCLDPAWPEPARAGLEVLLESLQQTHPEQAGFEPDRSVRDLRQEVGRFIERVRAEHQVPLFEQIDSLVRTYATGDHLAAFERCCDFRMQLEAAMERRAFSEQRYFLLLLDCLLEEMGYLALRHFASGFEVGGVPLDDCLGVVHRCARMLGNDGLYSRELLDLTAMPVHAPLDQRELLDVLGQVQRSYHRLVRRISAPYQALAARLGHDAGELQGMLANFQRTLHDLNSLAHFADAARGFVQARGIARHEPGEPVAPPDPWSFLHISHVEEIRQRAFGSEPTNLLDSFGGKGSGLLYLSHLGVPTRDGFILPTTLARLGLHERERERFEAEVAKHLWILVEDLTRSQDNPVRFGDARNPLLLAVRGGSVLSMPGMLRTVVFVGMTDAVAQALAEVDPWFAWDAYRRFLASYAAAAWELDVEQLDLIELAKKRHKVRFKTDLSGAVMREIVEQEKAWICGQGHAEELQALLTDPMRQLHAAVRAVHASWNSERARRYREVKVIGERWQTAVIVQQMAAGNRSNEAIRAGMDETGISLTGVIPCSRVTSTGFRELGGDVKFSASGDDLVDGLTGADSFQPIASLRNIAPMLERTLRHIDARLRRFRGTDPEIEFTVERGVLSVLQARSAESDTHDDPSRFVDPGPADARGIGIRGGAFRGLVAFDEQDLIALAATAADSDAADGVLLVVENPTPDEIPLILSADGLLTVRGGSTSHAAVAVQGLDEKRYCAVMGVTRLRIDAAARQARLVDVEGQVIGRFGVGDVVSIHGQTGEVFVGARAREEHRTENKPPAN